MRDILFKEFYVQVSLHRKEPATMWTLITCKTDEREEYEFF